MPGLSLDIGSRLSGYKRPVKGKSKIQVSGLRRGRSLFDSIIPLLFNSFVFSVVGEVPGWKWGRKSGLHDETLPYVVSPRAESSQDWSLPFSRFNGAMITTRVPLPGSDSILNFPPNRSTRSEILKRPKPPFGDA